MVNQKEHYSMHISVSTMIFKNNGIFKSTNEDRGNADEESIKTYGKIWFQLLMYFLKE